MPKISTLGEMVIELDCIDSTNNYAMQLINAKMAEHGLVIRADFQTAGKGQHGNVWMAEECKNLLCSVIINTENYQIENQFLFNCITCVALIEVLMIQYNLPNLTIKWPNDIYVHNKKLAGILIENSLRGSQWNFSVLGIGLNINQTHFPYLHNATSLKLLTNEDHKIMKVMKQLLKSINSKLKLFEKDKSGILDLYNKYLYKYGQKINYIYQNEMHQGTLKGVNIMGEIIIVSDNKIKHYRHKEIEWILD